MRKREARCHEPSKLLILRVLSNGFAGLAAPIRQPAGSRLTARCDYANASGELPAGGR